ncbi:MAG: DUF1573 domain-containing protein [Breznakibacter sp.]
MKRLMLSLVLLLGIGSTFLLFAILEKDKQKMDEYLKPVSNDTGVYENPYYETIDQAPEPGQSYDIEWKFKEYDFGELEKGTPKDSVKFSFVVKKGTAQITGSKSNCGCTLGDWRPVILKQGQTGTVTIKYDTKRVGYFNKSFEIFINRNSEPEILRIKGNVRDHN